MENQHNDDFTFFIKDQNEQTVVTLDTDRFGEHIPVLNAVVDSKLSSYDILTLSIPADHEKTALIEEDMTILFEDVLGWREYIISEVTDEDDGTSVRTIEAELSSVELLDEVLLEDVPNTMRDPEEALSRILRGTRWEVGHVDSGVYSQAFRENVEYLSVLEALDVLSSLYSCEVQFSYEVGDKGVTIRKVNLYVKQGRSLGKRFEIGKDVESISRTVDTSGIKTAIIPYTPIITEEESEFEGERITLQDVEWSVANGDPVDKPLGQAYLEHPDAKQAYGRLDADGKRRNRYISMELDVESGSELIRMAWVQLGRYVRPKVTYDARVVDLWALSGDEGLEHERVALGDEVVVIDDYFAKPIEAQSRVVELTRDLLDPTNNEITLGDSKPYFKAKENEDRVDEISHQIDAGLRNVIARLRSADGKTSNFYGEEDPNEVGLEGNEGDTYFLDDGNTQSIWIWKNGRWEIEIDTSGIKENADAIAEQQQDIAEMDDLIKANDEKAQNAYEAATGARDLAESHKQILEELGEDTLRFNHFVDTIDSTVRTIADDEYISQSVQASGIIQNEVSKIEIGGRNLILNSGGKYLKTPHSPYKPEIVIIDGKNAIVFNDKKNIINWDCSYLTLVDGEEYTFSFLAKGDRKMNLGRVYLNSQNSGFLRNTIVTTEWQKYSFTFTAIGNDAVNIHMYPSKINDDGTMDGFYLTELKLEKGTKATDWTPAPEDQENYTDTAVRTVQTQLDNSWAVKTLNDAGDVLSQLNVNSGGVKISGDLVYIDSPEMIADGIITNSLLADDISADKITVGKLFGNDVTANGINVNTIVGLNSSFLRTTWNGINTAIQIDSEYIRVHGTKGRKAYITPLAEFRSDAANGKYILMGNGRIQAYAPDVGALFILGSDLYNIKPEGQLGVMHRRRFAIGRYDRYSTDEGTPQLNPYIELGFWKDQSGYRDRNGMIRIHKPIMFEYRDNITGVGTLNAEQLIVAHGGYLRPDTSAGKYLSRLALGGSRGISFGVMTTSSYSRKAYIDNTHMYMFVTLSMEGRSITNVGSIGPRSERKYKKHIKPLKRVRDTIMSMNIYSYIKRGEFELGIMADEAPKEVLMPDEKSINLYSYASMLGKGLQEAFEEMDKIREDVAELKGVE